MRQYRGIRIDTNEWVYGWYFETGLGVPMITKDGFSHEVHPDTVGQSAGIKDKNGVEIYFGCQVKHVDSMGSRIGKVVFTEKMCCMGIEFEETTVFGGADLFGRCEIIGSIHDKEKQ